MTSDSKKEYHLVSSKAVPPATNIHDQSKHLPKSALPKPRYPFLKRPPVSREACIKGRSARSSSGAIRTIHLDFQKPKQVYGLSGKDQQEFKRLLYPELSQQTSSVALRDNKQLPISGPGQIESTNSTRAGQLQKKYHGRQNQAYRRVILKTCKQLRNQRSHPGRQAKNIVS